MEEAMTHLDSSWEFLSQYIAEYGLSVLGAILILFVGRAAAGMLRRMITRLMSRADVDDTVVGFTGNIVYALTIAFTVVAVLAEFGVETASFVAILGAASFAVGLALQGSLANFAAGVMVLLFRPFRAGDFIEGGGVAGTVKEIDLFATVLATPDNVRIIVPNGKLYGDVIKNYSAYDTRRVDLTIGIGYQSSIDDAIAAVQEIVGKDSRTLSDPEPFYAVSELADSSVNIVVRVWVKGADYWPVKFDFQKQIKEAFDAKGIEIPFPQMVMHSK